MRDSELFVHLGFGFAQGLAVFQSWGDARPFSLAPRRPQVGGQERPLARVFEIGWRPPFKTAGRRDDRSRSRRPLSRLYRLPQPAGLGQSASIRRRRRAPQRPAVRPHRLSRDARARFRGNPGPQVQHRAPDLRTAPCREPAQLRLPAEGALPRSAGERQAGQPSPRTSSTGSATKELRRSGR